MKEINTTTTEQSLFMYKETVSPSRKNLEAILSQLPEKKIESVKPAVRSPYIWFSVTQAVMFCFVVLALLPYQQVNKPNQSDSFYAIDQEIDAFEDLIREEEYKMGLVDYTS